MRILMLNPFFLPYRGGTENHVYEVATRLAKKHEVTVLTARLPGTGATEEIDGVNVERVPAVVLYKLPHPLPPPMPIMPTHSAVLRRLARENEVVHIHNRFIYGLEATGIIKSVGRPLCITLHNARPMGVDWSTDFLGQLYDDTIGRAVFSRCSGILAVSKDTMRITLTQDYSAIKGVAYNGVNIKLYNPKNSQSEGKEKFGLKKTTVLSVARFVTQKGLKYLIRAMKQVDAHLFLLGRGPELSNLQREVEAAKIEATIYTERLSNEDMALLYAACDVFVLPSLWEPFGMVVAEAMATGKPVVASKIGGIPEIVEDGKSGILVPTHDENAIAKAINFLLDNPKKARRMGIEGRKRVEQNFTWDKTAKAYEKLYANFEK
ncbi:MAG: glycosyltransferase family 4 protein [Candidatus Micrarchaeota archaeon]|nr:glycosyltransferase family 4 protein [Candidatus Micrarchaeota archaeon]